MEKQTYPSVYVRPYSPARSRKHFVEPPRSIGIVLGFTEARVIVAMIEDGHAVRRHVGKFSIDYMGELDEWRHREMLMRLRELAPTLPRWRVSLDAAEPEGPRAS